jgi:hypothetical protein
MANFWHAGFNRPNMVNYGCGGCGYPVCFDALAFFAIPVAPSDPSERKVMVDAKAWGPEFLQPA